MLIEAISATRSTSDGRDNILTEALTNVTAMLQREDRGWELLSGGEALTDAGLSLDDLKAWSLKLREDVVGAPWIKHGFSLRSSYIWQGGIQYDGVRKGGSGKGVNVQELIDNPRNQRAFFNKQARRRREGMLYHDGLAVWIGNDETKLIEVVPLAEITAILCDPDHSDIIYAYRREWSHRGEKGVRQTMKRWYFVDAYKDQSDKEIWVIPQDSTDPVKEEVEKGYTAFDMHANSVEGWAFGAPDALAAWIWNKIARDLYMDGVDVSSAMASIVFTASSKSAKGSQNASTQLATPMGAAGSVVLGGASEMGVMSSAGQGYDFSRIREVIALIATALDVSNIHLTSNPGDAGSSYGSAQSLDLPTRLAMEARRDEHIDLDLRVLRWMAGSGKAADEIKVYFKSLEDGTEVYRRLQAVTLPWLQGVISDEVYKELAAAALGVPSLGDTPDGMLFPNNKKSLPRKDIDADGSGGTGSTGSPSQGQSSGLDDAKNGARDARSDTSS